MLEALVRTIGKLLLVSIGDWPDAGAVLEGLAWTTGILLLMSVDDWPNAGTALEALAWTIGILLLMSIGDWPDADTALEVSAPPIGVRLLMVVDDWPDAGAVLEGLAWTIGMLLLVVVGDWPDAGAVLEGLAWTTGMLLVSVDDWPDGGATLEVSAWPIGDLPLVVVDDWPVAGAGFLVSDDRTIEAGRREADISFGRASERCVAAGVREPRTMGSDPGSAGEACMLVLEPCTSTSATTEGWSSGAEAAPIGVVPRPGVAIASRSTPAAMERVTPIGALCTAVDCANWPAPAGWTAAAESCVALTTGNAALVAQVSRPPQEGRTPGVPAGSAGTAACGPRDRYSNCGQAPHEALVDDPHRRWIASKIGSRPLASRATRSDRCLVTFSRITPGPGSTRW